MQEVMDGMAMCLQQWFAVGFLIGVLEPTRSRDAADCHQLSYQIIFKKFKKNSENSASMFRLYLYLGICNITGSPFHLLVGGD